MIWGGDNAASKRVAIAGKLIKAILRTTPLASLADIPEDLRGIVDPASPLDLVSAAYEELPTNYTEILATEEKLGVLSAAESCFTVHPSQSIDFLGACLAGPEEVERNRSYPISRSRATISASSEKAFDATIRGAAEGLHRWAILNDAPEISHSGLTRILGNLKDLTNRVSELQSRSEPSIQPLEARVKGIFARVQRLLPDGFASRHSERLEIRNFLNNENAWWWWQGGPWCGKSALMASIALSPPCPSGLAGVTTVPYFISRRDNLSDTRAAFLSSMLTQLSYHAELPESPRATDSLRALHDFHFLIAAATSLIEAHNKRLLIIVDGLDEDRYYAENRTASIVAALPEQMPGRTHVLLASRLNPSLPEDVPYTLANLEQHPLRRSSVHHTLRPTPEAEALRSDAERDLSEVLLHQTPPGRQVVAFMAACRVPLSALDLADFTGSEPTAVELLLDKKRESRCFVPAPSEDSWPCYELGHDTLRDFVVSKLDVRRRQNPMRNRASWETGADAILQPWRDEVHKRADYWSEQGWPIRRSPTFFAVGYTQMAVDRDVVWLASRFITPARFRFVTSVTESPFTAISQLDQVRNRLAETVPAEKGVLLFISLVSQALTSGVEGVPRSTIAVFSALGSRVKALQQARATNSPTALVSGLCMVAEYGARYGSSSNFEDDIDEALRYSAGIADRNARDAALRSIILTCARVARVDWDLHLDRISSEWVRMQTIFDAAIIWATIDPTRALSIASSLDNPDAHDGCLSQIVHRLSRGNAELAREAAETIDTTRHRERALVEAFCGLAASSPNLDPSILNHVQDPWLAAEALARSCCVAAVAGKGLRLEELHSAYRMTPGNSRTVGVYLQCALDIALACGEYTSSDWVALRATIASAPGSLLQRVHALAEIARAASDTSFTRLQSVIRYVATLVRSLRTLDQQLAAVHDILCTTEGVVSSELLEPVVRLIREWRQSFPGQRNLCASWANISKALLGIDDQLAESIAGAIIEDSEAISDLDVNQDVVAHMAERLVDFDAGLAEQLLDTLSDIALRNRLWRKLATSAPDEEDCIRCIRMIADQDVKDETIITVAQRFGQLDEGAVMRIASKVTTSQALMDRYVGDVAGRLASSYPELSIRLGRSLAGDGKGYALTQVAKAIASSSLDDAIDLIASIRGTRWYQEGLSLVVIEGSKTHQWYRAVGVLEELQDGPAKREAQVAVAVGAVVNGLDDVVSRIAALDWFLWDSALKLFVARLVSDETLQKLLASDISLQGAQGTDLPGTQWVLAVKGRFVQEAERVGSHNLAQRAQVATAWDVLAESKVVEARAAAAQAKQLGGRFDLVRALVAESPTVEVVEQLCSEDVRIASTHWLRFRSDQTHN